MGYEKLKPDIEHINEYWNIAIGLQKVDDLEPSKYLYELKDKNINNKLSNEELILHENFKKKKD